MDHSLSHFRILCQVVEKIQIAFIDRQKKNTFLICILARKIYEQVEIYLGIAPYSQFLPIIYRLYFVFFFKKRIVITQVILL